MEQSRNCFTPEAPADESASPSNTPADAAPSGIAFDPVPVRARIDGISPDKQRAFVEALADTGLVNVAAARIGVSEQAIARLRRRADARSFDLACHAARRLGARRLHALAWERAIEGTVKQHFYHGALVSEERVFDNRLLVYLLGKTEHLLDEPDREAREVAAHWEPWVEAMEHGTPPPDIRPAWERELDERIAQDALGEALDEEDPEDEDDEAGEDEIWWESDGWLTSFPPPAGFDGVEDGLPGDEDYRRTLTEAEEAALADADEEEAQERADRIARQARRRDAHFGFAGGLSEELEEQGIFFPMEAEPSETSAGASGRSEAVLRVNPLPGGERAG
jgi:hypothetical protein